MLVWICYGTFDIFPQVDKHSFGLQLNSCLRSRWEPVHDSFSGYLRVTCSTSQWCDILDLFSICSTMALCSCLHSNEPVRFYCISTRCYVILLLDQGGISTAQCFFSSLCLQSSTCHRKYNRSVVAVPKYSVSLIHLFFLIELLFMYFLLHFVSGSQIKLRSVKNLLTVYLVMYCHILDIYWSIYTRV